MAIHKPLDLESRGTSLYVSVDLLTQRSLFRHSGTAIAVARIFLTASQKFPSFSISGCLPAEKLAQPDRRSRAMRWTARVLFASEDVVNLARNPLSRLNRSCRSLPGVWFCIHNQQLVFILSGNLPSAKSTNLWHL